MVNDAKMNELNKMNNVNTSYSDEDMIIDAEENFRVITSSDFEETCKTNRFEKKEMNFATASNKGVRHQIENDKCLEELYIDDLIPKKVQTEDSDKQSKYQEILALKDLSDTKLIKSHKNSDHEENHIIEIIKKKASEKFQKEADNQINDNYNHINNKINKKADGNTISNQLLDKKNKPKMINKDKQLETLKIHSDKRASKNSIITNIIDGSKNNNQTNQNQCKNNSKRKLKTIFSIMSEEIYNQEIANNNYKKNNIDKNQKTDLYEKMINENTLHKIREKINKYSNEISKKFLTRNIQDSKLREFKKKMNYTTNSEHIVSSITRPQSALSSEKPNSIFYNNTKDIDRKSTEKRVRSPEKFFKDQIKWEEAKQSILERERLKFIDKNNGLNRSKPHINKTSYNLAIKNNKRFDSSTKNIKNEKSQAKKNISNNIHVYLTKMKIRNFKHNKDVIYKNLYTSPKSQQHLPEKDIKKLIDKLYNEKKKEQGKLKSFSNEIEIHNKHQAFQIGDSSNLVILKDFLHRFFLTLQEGKFLDQTDKKLNNNLFINYEDFNNILYKAGFLKLDQNKKVIEELKINNLDSHMKNNRFSNEQLKEHESALLRDAWRILISQNIEASNNCLDINILIIFLIVILGIYKGNDRIELNNKEKNNQKSKTIDLNLNEKSNILLEDNLNTNSNEFFSKTSNEFTQNYQVNDHKNSFKMTFATNINKYNNSNNNNCNHLNQTKKNNILNLSFNNQPNNFSRNIHNSYNNKRIELEEKLIEKNNTDNSYLRAIGSEINKLFTNFNCNSLVYNRSVTNQIRVIFREFYENWADKSFANKKSKRSVSFDHKIKEFNFSFRPKLDKSNNLHSTRYRNKILMDHASHLISCINAKFEDTDSNNIYTGRNAKMVALAEIYQNMKIKKER